MASSTRRPSPKSAISRATTFSQFNICADVFYFLSSVSFPPVTLSTAAIPSINAAFSATASSFCAYINHPFKLSACISEASPERWFHSRLTNHSISSSVGTNSSTGNGSMDTGMFHPRCGTWWYRFTRSTVIRSRLTKAGGGEQSNAAQYHPFTPCND